MNDEAEQVANYKQLSRNDLLWYNQSRKVVAVAVANFSVSPQEDVLNCTATTTITLPLAARGRELHVVKNFTGGSVTINRSGTDVIKGGSSITLTVDYTSVFLKAVNGGWLLLAQSA